MKKDKKVVIITGCSKKKLPYPAPAIDLNQGQLFKAIKKLALQHNFDMKILSGKHGLIEPHTILEPYDQKLTKKEDIEKFSLEINLKMRQMWITYELILVIMGKNYRKVIEPYFDGKFRVITHEKGIFGYLHLLSYFNTLSKEDFLKEIEKYRIVECAEYLWSRWDFDFPQKYIDPNRPHCCKFCTYRSRKNKNDTCTFSKLYPEYYQKVLGDRAFLDSLSTQNSIPEKIPISSRLKSNQKTTLENFIEL